MQADILVTGATGFLGSAVVDRLAFTSQQVRASDQVGQPPRDLPNYLPANILDPTAATAIVQGVRTVIHAAGLAHQMRITPEVVRSLFAVNVAGTETLARAAVAASVEHFVLLSSVSVYGRQGAVPCNEETPCRPVGAYAESKLAAEQSLLRVAEPSKMRVTILRLATAFGEGDRGNVARLMRAIDSRRFVWIGRGENRKTLVYRGDVASACAVTVEGGKDDAVQIYNVASPPCTMRDIVMTLASELQRPVPAWHVPSSWVRWGTGAVSLLAGKRGRLGSLHASVTKWLDDDVYDGTKFRQVLGFVAPTSLQEGIRREVAWYRGLPGSEDRQ